MTHMRGMIMQKHCWMIITGFLFMCVLGCSLHPHEDAKKAEAVRACISQCKVKQATCYNTCSDSCKQCEKEERATMIKRYKTYTHEQCVQGRRVALQLQSFRDPLQCRKTTCNCPADYRVCVGECRGNIRKYLQITPFCC